MRLPYGSPLTGLLCPRCEAIDASREKRWQLGDQGGKRPERRSGRTLWDALDGRWINRKHGIVIDIDTEMGSYRRAHPKFGRKTHRLALVKMEGNRVLFRKDNFPITARVGASGCLVMTSGSESMKFIYDHDGVKYRTCARCFGKSPWGCRDNCDCR